MGNLKEDVAAAGEVFDANVALGRRHDRRVTVDSVAGTLVEMDRVGVDRAVVYSTHAVVFDTEDGNAELVRAIGEERRLIPQFVCNPSRDDLSAFQYLVGSHSVRSIRMLPAQHMYPLAEWVVGPWLDWAASAGISVWMPVEYGAATNRSQLHVEQFGAAEVHEVAASHPDVTVVLSEVQYRHANWALKLLGALPNLHLELSRFVWDRRDTRRPRHRRPRAADVRLALPRVTHGGAALQPPTLRP